MQKTLVTNTPSQLLISRADAARMLGNVSIATIIRLEREGVLRPVRLNPRKLTAQVFYRHGDISALAHEPNGDAA